MTVPEASPKRLPSREELMREVQEMVDRERQNRRAQVQSFAPAPLAWLALTPAWTDTLAVACVFPVGAGGPQLLSSIARPPASAPGGR